LSNLHKIGKYGKEKSGKLSTKSVKVSIDTIGVFFAGILSNVEKNDLSVNQGSPLIRVSVN